MKNKGIYIFLSIIFLVIILFVVIDYASKRPDKRTGNPYEYSIDEYKAVDTKWLKYHEIKQIKLNCEKPEAINFSNGKIYLCTDSCMQIIDLSGKEIVKKKFTDQPSCIIAGKDFLMIGFKNYLAKLDTLGNILSKSKTLSEKSVFTAIAIKDNKIYIADAGLRKVQYFSPDLEKLGEFEGESGASSLHGFIIPSPYFDLAVNKNNELWVVNPGMHSLQQYKDDGSLIDFWEETSIEIKGFSGCCNPAHFTFLPNGDFVTSEKGLVRIKVYDAKGNLKAVVAPPDIFKEEGSAPDLTVDEAGTVYALDYDKKMIRIFELK